MALTSLTVKASAADERLIDTVAMRLRINAPHVVEEVMKMTLRQLESERLRHQQLLTKAQSLLSQSAIATGLATSFVGSLRDGTSPHRLVGWLSLEHLVGGAIIVGLLAVGMALAALWIRDTRELNREDILSPDELLAAHQANANPSSGSSGALQDYQRFLISALWVVYEHQVRRSTTVARCINAAQVLFGVFLLIIAVIGLLLVGTRLLSVQ